MELQLKRLRKERTHYTQAEVAELLGVKERTYASWERQEVMLSLEQAYDCAVILNCTIDEICGREPVLKSALDSAYRSLNPRGRGFVDDAVGMALSNPEFHERRDNRVSAG